jgi:dihydrofolate reductase
VLLRGDAVNAVAGIDENLGVLGSGELVRALLRAGLVDELVLTIHPLVLGSGRRMFADDGTLAAFRLVDATPTTTGVLIATYRPETA